MRVNDESSLNRVVSVGQDVVVPRRTLGLKHTLQKFLPEHRLIPLKIMESSRR
jgi:hypothetical protein